MKKLLSFLLLLVTLSVFAAGSAPDFHSRSFLLNDPVQTTNNMFVNFNTNFNNITAVSGAPATNIFYFSSTNIIYQMPNFIEQFSLQTSNCVPTYPWGNTNPVTPTFGSAGYSATNNLYMVNGVYVGPISYLGYYSSNIVANSYNTIYPSPFIAVPLYADANGDTPAPTLFISGYCDLVSSTNQFTLIFARLPDGKNIDWSTLLSVVLPLTGNTNNTMTTNLASTFITGCGALQLISVKTAGTNVNSYLNAVSLNGFMP